MMKLNLDVLKVIVLTGVGTDKISIYFNGPTSYPSWMPDYQPSLSIDVARGYGVEYCKNVFGIDPEVINI